MNKYKQKVEEILMNLNMFKAPIQIIDVANNYNFVVVEAVLDNDESGFLMIDNEGVSINGTLQKRIICVNHTDSPLRKRFTIAHELGHFFLEIEGKEEGKNFVVHRESSESIDRVKEREADLFASELLIPTALLEKELQNLTKADLILYDIPYYISKYFQVSRSCAEIRYERYMRGRHE